MSLLKSSKDSDLVSIPELEITLERINELEEDEEADEYGEVISPNKDATRTAIELVSQAAKSISDRFFKAWVSTDDSGGVVLTWSKPELDKSVRLVIPSIPDRKIYLHHAMGDEYGVEDNISATILSDWLSWCNHK